MGNYFEGRLNFMFKLGNDDITNEVLQFIYDTRYIDVIHQDDGEYYKAYVEYVSTHDDIISKGLRMYLDKYGDIRIHKSYIKYGIDVKDIALINRLANNEFDPDELVQYYEDDDGTVVFPPKEEATYDYIMRETLKELEATKDDISLVADIVIIVCEKYNGDEDLVKLIDLWSPYMYNDCIGNIRDEDQTFSKDYFRNNDGKIEHYEFCGDWCGSYYPTASCKSEFCKKLYDLGAESIKSKLSTSEWVEYEESGVRAGVKVDFKGYVCFHCGYQSETKEEICPKCLHVMVPGGEHMDQVEIPGGYNHD